MLIFHNFTDEAKAREFVAAATKEFQRNAWFCWNDCEYIFAEGQQPDETAFIRGALDVFPFVLTRPIVCVERNDDYSGESPVEERVEAFGGEFAGT